MPGSREEGEADVATAAEQPALRLACCGLGEQRVIEAVEQQDGHGDPRYIKVIGDQALHERADVAAPDMIDPAGLRTARKAGVFAVVDSEAGAIYRAE